MSAEKLREAIFNINTRRFGTVCEAIVQKIANFGEGRNQFHDLYCDITDSRIEVKFSRVQNRAQITIRPDTVIDAIFAELDENRTVSFDSWEDKDFDCNIQQIKCSEFDILYYGLFFWDKLIIFKLDSETIKSDRNIFYSDKQHKGNVGEGQFHVNNRTLQHHLNSYIAHDLNYSQLFEILTN